jgi:hypothetical protein
MDQLQLSNSHGKDTPLLVLCHEPGHPGLSLGHGPDGGAGPHEPYGGAGTPGLLGGVKGKSPRQDAVAM